MPSIAPEEWDFRPLTERNVETALLYELCRESKEVRNQIIECLDGTFTYKSRRRTKTTTRRQFLIETDGWPFQEDGSGLALLESEKQMDLCSAASLIWFNFPQFPKPFLTLPAEAILTPTQPRVYRYDTGLPFQVYALDRAPATAQAFTINAATSEDEMIKGFKTWLKESGIIRDGRGRREISFNQMRQLAAFRLSESGLNFKMAQHVIEEHRNKSTMLNPNSVLPNYALASGWHEAVEKGKHLVDSLLTWKPHRRT